MGQAASHERVPSENQVAHISAHDRQGQQADPVAALDSQERNIREKAIAIEEFRQLSEELRACYYRHGVNHQYECKPLVEQYLRRLADPDRLDSNPEFEVADVRERSRVSRI